MKKLGYAAVAMLIVVVGINEFIRVTPNDDGIIWFWLSQKWGSRGFFTSPSASPSWTDRERLEILGHLTFSMESSAAAEDIIRRQREKGQKPTKEDIQEIGTNIDRALAEASLVTDPALYKVHPGLPEQIREKYRPALSAIARGLSRGDKGDLARGAALYQDFKEWMVRNMSAFSYPPK
jgi:hypothetical protein